jgi:hypothetical protein
MGLPVIAMPPNAAASKTAKIGTPINRRSTGRTTISRIVMEHS